eukprot:comp5516_c0_seq1/m.1443 comp5516_c0_seq1/g.1443  ORF comp5516_c0_seq1/g.1443 comp5516_c0_seq1/m.1443 type:complete len:247 (-) comp5516_c0_seq1:36-776(-)
MRRGPGIAGIQRQQATKQIARQVGEQMEEAEMKTMTEQMEVFKTQLENFALKHKKDIAKNPVFRTHFQKMCAQVGVDPLASRKGFWSELLGVGDFYFELGVQIVEVCLAARPRNGGLMDLDDVMKQVLRIRPKHAQQPSIDDCERAIKKLKVLGKGFDVVQIGSRKLVQSVPTELNQDHSTALTMAADTACLKCAQLQIELAWAKERADAVLEYLVKEGMAWVDRQDGAEPTYWFPALWKGELELK